MCVGGGRGRTEGWTVQLELTSMFVFFYANRPGFPVFPVLNCTCTGVCCTTVLMYSPSRCSGTAHLAPALMALDTQAVFGAASGSSGSSTRLSTPGCAMLVLLLGQFPPNVVAPFWDSMGALPQGDVVRVAKDPSGSRVLEAALAVPAAQKVREWVGCNPIGSVGSVVGGFAPCLGDGPVRQVGFSWHLKASSELCCWQPTRIGSETFPETLGPLPPAALACGTQ